MKAPEKMSWKELQAAEREVRQAMLVAKQRDRDSVREEMDRIAAKHGFTVKEVFATVWGSIGMRGKR